MCLSEVPPSVREAAAEYIGLGLAVVPIPPRTKKAVLTGWPTLRITAEQVPDYFGDASNIGIILGPASGDLADVDLDCPEALTLADRYFPATGAETGRPSAPRSHRWYTAPGLKTTRFRDPVTNEMIIEVRGEGCQTVVGPSVHPEGERYDLLKGEPAAADAAALVAAARALAQEVLNKRYPDRPPPLREEGSDGAAALAPVGAPVPHVVDRRGAGVAVLKRASAYLAQMPPAIAGQNGHGRTYAAAVVLVHGFGLPPDQAFSMLSQEFNPRCEPPWTDRELRHKIDDAATKPHTRPFGWLRDKGQGESHHGGTGGGGSDSDGGGPGDARPTILLGTDEHRVIDEAVAALSRDPDIYKRGNTLVRVVLREDGAEIAPMAAATLREKLTASATILRVTKNGDEKPAHPPQWLVPGISDRGYWDGIRPLAGVSSIPVLRPDGSVLQTPGWDPHTHVLYCPVSAFPTIPESPTLDDALAAVDALIDVVEGFRFADDEHRAAWIAAVLTCVCRSAFDGPSPIFVVDANVRGAGKGLLVQTVSRIAHGRDTAVTAYAHEEQEMRKRITCYALTGTPMVILDNVVGKFGNPSLDIALTGSSWSDRLLGANREVSLPLKAVWFATGNNIKIVSDTGRRVIHIRLKVLEERPEERDDFKHPDLLGFVQAHRATLVTAALTIVAAYIRAGKPAVGLKPMGSFEGWSGLIRSAVVWTGQPDPCLSQKSLMEEADAELEAIRQLQVAWSAYDAGNQGIVLAPLVNTLFPERGVAAPADQASLDLRAALEVFAPGPGGQQPTARTIGNRLGAVRERVVDGRMFVADAQKTSGGKRWRLVRADGRDSVTL